MAKSKNPFGSHQQKYYAALMDAPPLSKSEWRDVIDRDRTKTARDGKATKNSPNKTTKTEILKSVLAETPGMRGNPLAQEVNKRLQKAGLRPVSERTIRTWVGKASRIKLLRKV